MAQAVNMHRSDAGALFTTEHDALKDDLRYFILNEIKNEASAKQLADAMVRALDATPPVNGSDDRPVEGWQGLRTLINRLYDTRPENPQPALALSPV